MCAAPVRQLLQDDRHHFSHGPIDLVIDVTGEVAAVARALDRAWARFQTVLPELAAELPVLRRRCTASTVFDGPVARRMQAAVLHFSHDTFVTPMAAVAGAVADEICAVIDEGGPFERVHVNNGGDIALRLAPGRTMRIGLAPDPTAAVRGRIALSGGDGIAGVATSGRHGRSFSLGIADAVTVLSHDAASADVAATLIANAVDLQSPRVKRTPAADLDPDSDLGDRPVTVAVEPLSDAEVAKALDAGAARGHEYLDRGLIGAAALHLQSGLRIVAEPGSEVIRQEETAWT
jgi:ApbE superfamily uncharacterized protein (UPF0280 family)